MTKSSYIITATKNEKKYAVYDFCKYSKPPVKLCWDCDNLSLALKCDTEQQALDLLHEIREVCDLDVKVCLLKETIEITELEY